MVFSSRLQLFKILRILIMVKYCIFQKTKKTIKLSYDLLSQIYKSSTIGDDAFHFGVRNGIRWFHVSIIAKIDGLSISKEYSKSITLKSNNISTKLKTDIIPY